MRNVREATKPRIFAMLKVHHRTTRRISCYLVSRQEFFPRIRITRMCCLFAHLPEITTYHHVPANRILPTVRQPVKILGLLPFTIRIQRRVIAKQVSYHSLWLAVKPALNQKQQAFQTIQASVGRGLKVPSWSIRQSGRGSETQ